MSSGSPFLPARTASLGPVVEALCSAGTGWEGIHSKSNYRREFPSRQAIVDLMDDVRSVLFPGFFGPAELTAETLKFHTGAALDRILHGLQDQIRRGLCATCGKERPEECGDCFERSRALAEAFILRLPEVRRFLGTDVEAAYVGDPALTNPDEAIFCYPGILAVTSQRVAHELHAMGVPLLPRMITEHASPASTSTPAPASGRGSSSTTAPASSSGRRPSSGRTSGSTRASLWGPRASPWTRTATPSRGWTGTPSWRTTWWSIPTPPSWAG
jgi:hypothetical protein